MSRNTALTSTEHLRTLKASLRQCRARCAGLERQVGRLLTSDYQQEAEREIARLTERIIEIEARWEEAEHECSLLRRQLLQEVAA